MQYFFLLNDFSLETWYNKSIEEKSNYLAEQYRKAKRFPLLMSGLTISIFFICVFAAMVNSPLDISNFISNFISHFSSILKVFSLVIVAPIAVITGLVVGDTLKPSTIKGIKHELKELEEEVSKDDVRISVLEHVLSQNKQELQEMKYNRSTANIENRLTEIKEISYREELEEQRAIAEQMIQENLQAQTQVQTQTEPEPVGIKRTIHR